MTGKESIMGGIQSRSISKVKNNKVLNAPNKTLTTAQSTSSELLSTSSQPLTSEEAPKDNALSSYKKNVDNYFFQPAKIIPEVNFSIKANISQEISETPRENHMCYVALETDGTLGAHKKRINLSAKKAMEINTPFVFSGSYAFLIGREGSSKQQFLLLKPFDKQESNHGAFLAYKRNIPGYSPTSDNLQIIAGGEITFHQGAIYSWNLKSGGFSQGSEFDERIAHLTKDNSRKFHECIKDLWLPIDRYKSINQIKKEALYEKIRQKALALSLLSNYILSEAYSAKLDPPGGITLTTELIFELITFGETIKKASDKMMQMPEDCAFHLEELSSEIDSFKASEASEIINTSTLFNGI
jgi:hypothetical protein